MHKNITFSLSKSMLKQVIMRSSKMSTRKKGCALTSQINTMPRLTINIIKFCIATQAFRTSKTNKEKVSLSNYFDL